ncbi:MAG: tyrosine-type recombinase/integrase [Bacteroidota bacterium]|nr:tyrosine-type recombinase/integrase [Bacteroidota bacterium]
MRTTLTIDQCVNQFIAEQQIVAGSAKTYRANLLNFFKWCDRQGLDKRNLNESDVVKFALHLNSTYSAKYARSVIITLKKYYGFLAKHGFDELITKELKMPKNSKDAPRQPLTREDKAALIAKFENKTTISKKRDYLMIELMLTSGLRCNEVSGLMISSLYKNDNVWSMKVKRKCHYRDDDWIAVDHMMDDIEEYIQELNTAFPECKYLFMSFSRRRMHQPLSATSIGKIVKNYLGPKYSAHCLRHTCANDLLNNGFSYEDVSALLGHSSVETTKMYMRYAIDRRKRQNNPSKYLKSELK